MKSKATHLQEFRLAVAERWLSGLVGLYSLVLVGYWFTCLADSNEETSWAHLWTATGICLQPTVLRGHDCLLFQATSADTLWLQIVVVSFGSLGLFFAAFRGMRVLLILTSLAMALFLWNITLGLPFIAVLGVTAFVTWKRSST